MNNKKTVRSSDEKRKIQIVPEILVVFYFCISEFYHQQPPSAECLMHQYRSQCRIQRLSNILKERT